MNTDISNKKVLFLCTDFFSYYQIIIEELEKMGAKVKYIPIPRFPESHRNLAHSKSYLFFYHYLKNPLYRTRWTNSLIERIKDEDYDYLLCIGDVPFKSFFLDRLKEMNPKIKTCLFLWDKFSIVYVPPKVIEKFDRKFSFDRDDSKKVNGLQYLPDFYIEGAKNTNCKEKYDLCIIATYIGSRAKTTSLIKELCESNGLKVYTHLLLPETEDKSKFPWYFFKNKKAKQVEIQEYEKEGILKRYRLSSDEVDDIQSQSRAILDFSYRGRQGLTLNAVSALAKGKKLITSNFRIKEESFYTPNNIYIYDFDNPQFDIDFFNIPLEPMDMSYLRIDNWLKYIICDE